MDGSVSKVLTTQARGPEFGPWHPCRKPSVMGSTCNPSAEEQEKTWPTQVPEQDISSETKVGPGMVVHAFHLNTWDLCDPRPA